ncbi:MULTISPECIES: potassium channel family protein [unclassified Coleofasciculus]|uniref:potassium channel family protein n=1 Tax=unclassified Coleofasciculus TaxID=2692782 RepID=UPI00187EB113|nr:MULTISPECIES: TrkA family potassium uptake protein [unclassified Coleofasciculus]MBE9129830.1 TrkA family potassium uptake protein [Coleofasciculus sp. LEGE 07081]MBE9151961.1 TrkA family potassium uptake protein [Coleofasciculus sp. LEGE 07092]
MYLIILGAAPEGSSLIDLAIEDGHEVALIEKNEEQARAVLQKHDIKVFNADISDGEILEEANIQRADALIATTSDDSVNLMAMFLGKEYGINTLISMVNERTHQKMFERLGVKVLVNPELIIAKQLYRFANHEDD